MTERISRSQIRDLTEGKDEGTATMIELVARDINRAEENIRRGLEILAGRMATIESRLDEGFHVEEQLTRPASDVETAIALRTQAWRLMTGLVGPEIAAELTKL